MISRRIGRNELAVIRSVRPTSRRSAYARDRARRQAAWALCGCVPQRSRQTERLLLAGAARSRGVRSAICWRKRPIRRG